MDSFYVTLPSNVKSINFHKENTIANYVTKLAHRLILNGEWEVGVVEVSYTMSFYNLPQSEKIEIYYYEHGLVKKKYLKGSKTYKGRYDLIEQIIDEIKECIKVYPKSNELSQIVTFPTLEVNHRNRIVTIKNGIDSKNRCVFLGLSPNLCEILGFDHSQMLKHYGKKLLEYSQIESRDNPTGNPDFKHAEPTTAQLTYRGKWPYEIAAGYHSIFIYCDIVKPSLVGDSYTQLLRLVQIPTNAKFGEQVLISYSNVYYVPVLSKDFETIEIHLVSELGDSIPFQFGRTFVTLHFRRKL